MRRLLVMSMLGALLALGACQRTSEPATPAAPAAPCTSAPAGCGRNCRSHTFQCGDLAVAAHLMESARWTCLTRPARSRCRRSSRLRVRVMPTAKATSSGARASKPRFAERDAGAMRFYVQGRRDHTHPRRPGKTQLQSRRQVVSSGRPAGPSRPPAARLRQHFGHGAVCSRRARWSPSSWLPW